MSREHALRKKLVIIVAVISLLLQLASLPAFGQKSRRKGKSQGKRPPATSTARAKPKPKPKPEPLVSPRQIEQAMGMVCAERARDPLGSIPIDEMQARASLELNHPEAVIGAQRARRLLPLAKELVIEALRQLASEQGISARQVRAAALRVRAVTHITPDPDLRDNAAVIMSDPHTIRFGTIFLVGLPSDEGMISVLSHELTHIADGRQNSLQALFYLVGRRAARQTGLRINAQKAEELTCDLVGVRAARTLVARTPGDREPQAQRLSRSLAHNCVDNDETDEDHLSPRSTMRAVLSLDPTLTRALANDDDNPLNQIEFRTGLFSGAAIESAGY